MAAAQLKVTNYLNSRWDTSEFIKSAHTIFFFQIRAFPAAEKSCSQVLQVDPDNVKALFRKGKVGQTLKFH